MSTPLSLRLKAAVNLVFKGSWEAAYFNRPDLTPGSTGSQDKLTQPYAQSVWVNRAIKKVAQPIAAVPLRFTVDAKRGEQEFEDPNLSQFWQRPAVGLSMFDFIEATVGWLKLRGEAFWVMDDTWLVPFPSARSKMPSPLILVRPDELREIVVADQLIGWRWQTARGKAVDLLAEQVIQIKYWNPANPWRGQSELDPAWNAAEGDYLTGTYQRNVARNNGDQGQYVIAKGGLPTDEQRAQIVAQLRSKRAAAQRGDFVPVFLGGDIEIGDPKIQQLDAAMLSARLQNRHEIFLAFGVPPSMADIQASYSIGSASDWFMLINETCMPTGEKIDAAIDLVASKMTGKMLYSWFDWDEHPVMQAVRRERLEAVDKLWSKGMPMAAINDYLGLGMAPFDGWDVGFLPFSVAPATSVAEPFEDPPEPGSPADVAATEPTDDTEISEMMRALRVGPQTGERRPETGDTTPKMTAKELLYWRKLMASRREVTRTFESRFNRVVFAARAHVLRRIDELSAASKSVAIRAAAADFMFDEDEFSRSLIAAMRKTAAEGLATAGKQLFVELGKDDPFTVAPAEVLAYFSKRENKIKDIGRDVFGQIQESLKTGIDAGETAAQLADRVRAEFNGISTTRARTIATTETTAVYGAGRHEAMTRAGIQYKRWLSAEDDKVRFDHLIANGQTALIDEPYQVGGEELMHPGDSRGSGHNVINCRCVSVPVEALPPEEI